MFERKPDTGSLRPQELEAVYAISRAVARAADTENALDEIIRLARPVFIFDNMVLYLQRKEKALEPTYARAIGRGRFREADLAWGDFIANEAFNSMQTVIRVEELAEGRDDRTGLRYFLSMPLYLGKRVIGALVFIRFGGPPYAPGHIHLAEFIADHVAQLLGHRQLVERVASLEAKRRLDSLQDDFIATVSHELLTPLGFIKGYATTLLREDTTWDDATRNEFLTIIDEEADRLRELIDNLMDSSRLQAGTLRINFQPIRLEALLRDIAQRAASRSEKTEINLSLNAPGLQIQGDPTRLAQVFENLLSNAGKYAPGSPINISLDIIDDQACIEVQDKGPGIAPEHLEQIFKRFYRVPGNTTSMRGTGLGLYICRQIIQAHHGVIKAQSKLGEGTTFIISLPYERRQVNTSSPIQEAHQ
jgi:two-component system sensor histidine kinase KdpD